MEYNNFKTFVMTQDVDLFVIKSVFVIMFIIIRLNVILKIINM